MCCSGEKCKLAGVSYKAEITIAFHIETDPENKMMNRSSISWILLLLSLSQVLPTHREHKVHNIVLYPDKHSWCKITPIKQVVTYPGCSSVEIDNNVCVGTCFSYSIPRTLPSAPGELIKPYCDSCQPSDLIWRNLTLTCKGEDSEGFEMQKSVQIISNCSCSTCDVGDDGNSLSIVSSGDGDIVHRQLEGQELMDWMMETPGVSKLGMNVFNTSTISDSNFSTSDPIMNERLLIVVKQLAGSGEYSEEEATDKEAIEWENADNQETRLDKVALKELLREVEGVDHTVNQETLGDFVRQVEQRENIKVDLDRLRGVLTIMQHELQQEKQQTPHKSQTEQKHSEEAKHHGNPHQEQRKYHSHYPQHHQNPHPTHQHLQHQPHENQHHARQHLNQHQPQITDRKVELSSRDDMNKEPRGERLDVEPHQLKPALEGGELSYHDNLVPANEGDSDTNKQEEF